LAVRLAGILHLEGRILHAVAVDVRVPRDLVFGTERARDHQADRPLLEDVRCPVADARLRPGVRNRLEAERLLVEVGALLRVPDPQLDVIPALEGHEVLAHESPC
jgi:hypothetical protein